MMSAAGWEQSVYDPRRKQILQADAPEQSCPDAVGHTIDDLRTVLRRVDMGAEGPFAERHVDDPDDRLGDCTDIGIGRFERREPTPARPRTRPARLNMTMDPTPACPNKP
jgi:hypothetical protein